MCYKCNITDYHGISVKFIDLSILYFFIQFILTLFTFYLPITLRVSQKSTPVWRIIKQWSWVLFNQHLFVKTYAQLHFQHKNYVTIIVKLLYGTRSHRWVALWSLIMIGRHFYVQHVIAHRFSWNKCFIIYPTNAEKIMQHVTILHR